MARKNEWEHDAGFLKMAAHLWPEELATAQARGLGRTDARRRMALRFEGFSSITTIGKQVIRAMCAINAAVSVLDEFRALRASVEKMNEAEDKVKTN